MLDLPEARRRMVDRQLRARGIKDERVLQAMLATPREAFAPAHLAEFAYDDAPLPIAAGQTISQPYIVAHMIEAAQLEPGDRVLEVGAGSGYAAAVMAAIAAEVYTIERRRDLAKDAEARLRALGYANVEVRIGDGSAGLPEAQPFDAILVAAAAPSVPEALKEQLAVGGCLVLPVGGRLRSQRLIKLTRRSPAEFEEELLGDVSFVPLIGAYGWPERREPARSAATMQAMGAAALSKLIRRAAEPLPDFEDPAFATLFGRFASARVVLLGEAAEGTSEFQRARAAITRRLIAAHGFNIVAVAADRDDAAPIDRFVNAPPGSDRTLRLDALLPKWRNADFVAFPEWLRGFNDASPPERRTGFYGLDREDFGAVHTIFDTIPEAPSSWNLRARRTFETLMQLLPSKEPNARAVVWAHNVDVGDARFTDMGWLGGAVSLGQLCRERFGDAAQLIGFGMNAGTASAAERWNGETEIVTIGPAQAGSYEQAAHDTGIPRMLIDLREGVDDALRAALEPPRLERFIGEASGAEQNGRYARASLARQFDAYVWFDSSHAARPLAERPPADISHPIPI